MKVGIGYDIHTTKKGRRLFLGGVEIPHKTGLDGHSDADVLLHAISDAMLGALGAGDIGEHFPNTAEEYKDISSLILLERVWELVSGRKFGVSNVDTILIAEEPKIGPFKDKMRDNISRVLKLEKKYVNIKATTSEGTGPIGRGEAIAAYAVVSLKEA